MMDNEDTRTDEQRNTNAANTSRLKADSPPPDANPSASRTERSTERSVDRVARAERERQASVENKDGDGTDGMPDITQVGQIIRDRVGNLTRQLPRELPRRAPPPSTARAPVSSVLRERIAVLVAALGDPDHALHQQAVQELVEIGDAAVPALNEALNPRRSWLTNYRAAEALGQIGDGRATGPLIEALRNTNSNVRWSAVRALAAVGDARALLELRRVARDDQGKTSWGESVAGAAQSAIEQMRAQNVLLRGAELVQTAIACVLMLVALILAWSVVTSLRTELRQIGHETVTPITSVQAAAQITPQPAQDAAPVPTAEPAPEATAEPAPTATAQITGTVRSTANVRAAPSVSGGDQIGIVNAGDTIIFETSNADRSWYRVRLGQRAATGSKISSSDGSGWVSATLLSTPDGSVPVERSQENN